MEEKPYGQIVTQKKKEKRLHKIGKDTVGDYIIIGFLIVFAFIAFFPVWYTIVGSAGARAPLWRMSASGRGC